MNFETGIARVPLWMLLSGAILLATAGFGYWYYHLDPADAKLVGFVGGIVTGLLVYLATFITLLRPLRELDHFHRMGIKALLANRHDKEYYRRLLRKCRQRVDVTGASCSRFVRDFLDVGSDDKVLIDALTQHRHLRVRLLIPNDRHMSQEARASVRAMLNLIQPARAQFGDRIEIRRFDDSARHSFVLVDGDLIAGPVFDSDRSRHAPAVHVAAETLFGQKYTVYFDDLWNGAAIVA